MKKIIINGQQTDYEISKDGKVFSNKTNKFLQGSVYNTGYRMVRLTIGGSKKSYAIHRLVAETFLQNPKKLPIVNHKDGNKLNNKVDNLEWVNQSENRTHAVQNKISKLANGKRNKIRKDTLKISEWKRYKNSNYLVSKNGKVFNEKTEILLKETPNQAGYIRYTLRIDNKNCTKLAHSLVIESWLDLILTSSDIINHIDGDKTNNSLQNLEISNKKDNALHSFYILNKNVKPVIRYNEEKSLKKEYPSLTKAAAAIGLSPSGLYYIIKKGNKYLDDYWMYK